MLYFHTYTIHAYNTTKTKENAIPFVMFAGLIIIETFSQSICYLLLIASIIFWEINTLEIFFLMSCPTKKVC